MKKTLWLVICTVLAVGSAFGQSATSATQQQIDTLSGQIQDLTAMVGQQTQQISALQQAVSDLRDKINSPAMTNVASRGDLRKLARQVQELDQKRIADRKLILKEIENLSQISASPSPAPAAADAGSDASSSSTPQKGYNYKVQAGDTIAAIAKAYRSQGVKVTIAEILKANPKVNPKKLSVGQKIFIPDPNAK